MRFTSVGFSKPQGSLVSGRTQASLQELADCSDCVLRDSSPDGGSPKELHFVPKSLIVLQRELTPGVWDASLERVTHRSGLMWTEKNTIKLGHIIGEALAVLKEESRL